MLMNYLMIFIEYTASDNNSFMYSNPIPDVSDLLTAFIKRYTRLVI